MHRWLPGLKNLFRSRLLFQIIIPNIKVSNLAGTVFNLKTKARCETKEGNAQFVTVQFFFHSDLIDFKAWAYVQSKHWNWQTHYTIGSSTSKHKMRTSKINCKIIMWAQIPQKKGEHKENVKGKILACRKLKLWPTEVRSTTNNLSQLRKQGRKHKIHSSIRQSLKTDVYERFFFSFSRIMVIHNVKVGRRWRWSG